MNQPYLIQGRTLERDKGGSPSVSRWVTQEDNIVLCSLIHESSYYG